MILFIDMAPDSYLDSVLQEEFLLLHLCWKNKKNKV